MHLVFRTFVRSLYLVSNATYVVLSLNEGTISIQRKMGFSSYDCRNRCRNLLQIIAISILLLITCHRIIHLLKESISLNTYTIEDGAEVPGITICGRDKRENQENLTFAEFQGVRRPITDFITRARYLYASPVSNNRSMSNIENDLWYESYYLQAQGGTFTISKCITVDLPIRRVLYPKDLIVITYLSMNI